MSIFSQNILKLLNDYKRLLKRYLPNSERDKIIINLGIKRKSLKSDNDVILYNKAHRVLSDIEYWTDKINRSATEYSGVDEFYQHMKQYLSEYRVENNQIIHVSRQVSCALVQAIQLISLQEAVLSDSQMLKLDDCVQTVAKFGSKDQRIMLAKALHKQRSGNTNFSTPVLDTFFKSHEFAVEEQFTHS